MHHLAVHDLVHLDSFAFMPCQAGLNHIYANSCLQDALLSAAAFCGLLP